MEISEFEDEYLWHESFISPYNLYFDKWLQPFLH